MDLVSAGVLTQQYAIDCLLMPDGCIAESAGLIHFTIVSHSTSYPPKTGIALRVLLRLRMVSNFIFTRCGRQGVSQESRASYVFLALMYCLPEKASLTVSAYNGLINQSFRILGLSLIVCLNFAVNNSNVFFHISPHASYCSKSEGVFSLVQL